MTRNYKNKKCTKCNNEFKPLSGSSKFCDFCIKITKNKGINKKFNFKEKKCNFENCNIIFKPTSGVQKFCENCKLLNYDKYQLQYYQNNAENLIKYQSEYYNSNIEDVKIYKKKYRANNKDFISAKNYKYKKARKENDIEFKLKENIASSIRGMLKLNNSSKAGKSILKYLGYSIKELKEHIENQFEDWMNWNNQWVYKLSEWNNNDKATWKWQLDHITPHSEFKYTSMEDEEFKKCWTLSNLRPLSAKQNQKDGATRIRHKK